MPTWLWIVVAYLIGSVSFAVVVSKLFALPDPHSYGSGNPGATNVLRTGNKAAAALTLLGDGAKGWLAVFLAKQFVPGIEPWLLAAVGLAVFVGHLFPVFHRFAGGKGVATAAGILLAIDWRLAAAALAVWLALALMLKISSVSSIAAAVAAPIASFYFLGNQPVSWMLMVMTVLLIWRHRGNIEKLLAGRETTLGR